MSPKFLADYHAIPITDERYQAAWQLAESRALPVLLHTWGNSQFDGHTVVRKVAERYTGLFYWGRWF